MCATDPVTGCQLCGTTKNVWTHLGYCSRCVNFLARPDRKEGSMFTDGGELARERAKKHLDAHLPRTVLDPPCEACALATDVLALLETELVLGARVVQLGGAEWDEMAATYRLRPIDGGRL